MKFENTKYKAKSTIHDYFEFGNSVVLFNGDYHICDGMDAYEDGVDPSESLISIKYETICEFTGFNDVEGAEIYEWDNVTTTSPIFQDVPWNTDFYIMWNEKGGEWLLVAEWEDGYFGKTHKQSAPLGVVVDTIKLKGWNKWT